jgi:hypothetical protein
MNFNCALRSHWDGRCLLVFVVLQERGIVEYEDSMTSAQG